MTRRRCPLWRTLTHGGLIFQEPYVPTGVPVVCEGRSTVRLSPEAEEYATAYANLIFWVFK